METKEENVAPVKTSKKKKKTTAAGIVAQIANQEKKTHTEIALKATNLNSAKKELTRIVNTNPEEYIGCQIRLIKVLGILPVKNTITIG